MLYLSAATRWRINVFIKFLESGSKGPTEAVEYNFCHSAWGTTRINVAVYNKHADLAKSS